MTFSPIIYLDMDGVCVDFVTASIMVNGGDPVSAFSAWETTHRGVFYIEQLLGIDRKAFWKEIESGGEAFWRNLQPYPWFDDLYAGLKEFAPVVFLTTPGPMPDSASGKLAWLQNRFGKFFNDYVFTPRKELLARPETLLVDDYDRNVENYRLAGGATCLFPQPWNANADYPDPLAYALQEAAGWHKDLTQGS